MVAFGVQCLWWDSASRAAVEQTVAGVLLRCPYCGGRCELHADKESFLSLARRLEVIGFAGHREMIEWVQGRCFKTRSEAWLAYLARPPQHRDATVLC